MGLYKNSRKTTNHFVHIKKDDPVIVISGDDKGKRGTVVEASPKEGKIIVEGVNMASKHVKPRRQGDPGGIIDVESAIYACKVMLYCSKCGKGVRIKHRVGENKDKVRICGKCGDEI